MTIQSRLAKRFQFFGERNENLSFKSPGRHRNPVDGTGTRSAQGIQSKSSTCRVLGTALLVSIGALVHPHSAASQTNVYRFEISVRGEGNPILDVSTNVPNGTTLFVDLKKPWLPDATQRLARGLPACEDDCISAMTRGGMIGETVIVRNGRFTAGPFSFRGAPPKPATYPVQISLSADVKTATMDQIRAIGTVLHTSTIQISDIPRSTVTTPQRR